MWLWSNSFYQYFTQYVDWKIFKSLFFNVVRKKKIIKKSFNRLNPWVNPFILCQGTWPQIDSDWYKETRVALQGKQARDCYGANLFRLPTPISLDSNHQWQVTQFLLISNSQIAVQFLKEFFFLSQLVLESKSIK